MNKITRARIIKIVALVVVVLVGAVAWVVGYMQASRKDVYQHAMINQLRNLAARQAEYYDADRDGDGAPDAEFANDISMIADLPAEPGVVLQITSGDKEGFGAIATDAQRPGERCVMFVGNVATRPMTSGGKEAMAPGSPICD